ncbi:MAG: ribonuclease P protein component [Pseudomonadota bacterium]
MATPPPILRKRRDFVACSRARRWATPGFTLQARRRRADEAVSGVRVGYTCSKKVGNAVTRNRAKRRLRAIAADILAGQGRDGWDYVLIGRFETTVARPFEALKSDLAMAIERVHRPRPAREAP